MKVFDDDETELNAELIPKPSLCTTCAKDDVSKEEQMCLLNRLDQQGEEAFHCDAYVNKYKGN